MLCKQFGFDMSIALELSSTLGSRCHNLRNFCLKLGRFWWYPVLASAMIKRLNHACEEDVRPSLVLRHITIVSMEFFFKFMTANKLIKYLIPMDGFFFLNFYRNEPNVCSNLGFSLFRMWQVFFPQRSCRREFLV
jgi:hypothetical protein